MADIKCAICGEPWDSWHVRHDMIPWESELFRKGAGCPECGGEPGHRHLATNDGVNHARCIVESEAGHNRSVRETRRANAAYHATKPAITWAKSRGC